MMNFSVKVAAPEYGFTDEYSALDRTGQVLGRYTGARLRSAIALLLALSIPTQASAYDTVELGQIGVYGTGIDFSEWVPSGIPYGEDPGFDLQDFIPNGYLDQRYECADWLSNTPLPAGCDANVKPEPVAVSDPPCGPDGSIWSNLVPQGFANACSAHDVCYSQYSTTQAGCNQAFRSNMDDICELQYLGQTECRAMMTWDGRTVCFSTSPAFQQCVNQSTIFYNAVQGSWAINRFNALRSVALCRQWHERKENESNCP
jgi:hypothetical protein